MMKKIMNYRVNEHNKKIKEYCFAGNKSLVTHYKEPMSLQRIQVELEVVKAISEEQELAQKIWKDFRNWKKEKKYERVEPVKKARSIKSIKSQKSIVEEEDTQPLNFQKSLENNQEMEF